MVEKISRRNFLKGTGIATGVILLSGCTANLQQPVWMESYNRAPEETLPGEDFWFASTCRMCPAGCGIVARVSNGRARKLEGNAEHPLNRGRLCARGQAGLQLLYHPDRVRQVLKRTGERGQNQWGTTGWDAILDEIAETLKKTDPARIAVLTGYLPDYQSALVARFTGGLGTNSAVVYDTQSAFDGRVVLQAASEALFGTSTLPVFDIANADVVFGFGADFLETWLSPVAYSKAYGDMRGQTSTRGTMIAFEPRLSMTAAAADRWLPVPPGSEGLVALALGKLITDAGLAHNGNDVTAFQSMYAKVNVDAIAAQTGISTAELTRFAELFANAHHPIAIPGGKLAGYSNGLDAVKAVLALNIITGTTTAEHGILFLSPEAPSRNLQPVLPGSFADVQALTQQMANGAIDVLLILDANPVYELPTNLGFADALQKVSTVISFATLLDETATVADIVLPMHTYLETWGYQLVNPSPEKTIISAQQPVVRPLYDSRDTADVLLALANKLGGDVARKLPWQNLVGFIQTRLTALQLLQGNFSADKAETFWAQWLQHGGWWSQETTRTAPVPGDAFSTPLTVTQATFDGADAQYPYFLMPVPSVTFGDGRHASLPWLQETPDPMTTAAWETWVEINPATAAKLGVKLNDVVIISSPYGKIKAAVYPYHGIHPQVIAIPVGQGHTALGRWAKNRGANVLSILSPQTTTDTGQLTWASTRVQIVPTGTKQILPLLESNLGVERFRRQQVSKG